MLALHSAYQAIRSGQCSMAIVGGINVLLKPHTSVQFMKLGMLSPTGTCRSFDKDGEPRGQGAASLDTTQSSPPRGLGVPSP